MSEYAAGFIVGMLVVVAIAAFLAWKMNGMRKGSCRYDERQELVRGRGFKYGFLTLLIYDVLLGGMYVETMPDWCDMMAVNALGIVVAILVFGVYCIWNDAYIGFSESRGTVYLLFLGIGGMNLICGTMNLLHGSIMVDGRLTFRCMNLLLAAVFLIFAAVFWLHNHVRVSGEE